MAEIELEKLNEYKKLAENIGSPLGYLNVIHSLSLDPFPVVERRIPRLDDWNASGFRRHIETKLPEAEVSNALDFAKDLFIDLVYLMAKSNGIPTHQAVTCPIFTPYVDSIKTLGAGQNNFIAQVTCPIPGHRDCVQISAKTGSYL